MKLKELHLYADWDGSVDSEIDSQKGVFYFNWIRATYHEFELLYNIKHWEVSKASPLKYSTQMCQVTDLSVNNLSSVSSINMPS